MLSEPVRRRQAAQVVLWVAVMLPFFLATAGLVIDAGRVLATRREVQNVADGAARVAAMQIDEAQLRQNGTLQLDFDRARTAAERYVRDQATGEGWQPPRVARGANGGIAVTLDRAAPTSFLRIVNVRSLTTVEATARAEACVGIQQGVRLGGGACN